MKNYCLDDGTVRSFRDGEITGGRRTEVAAHLQSCATCRQRVAEADARRERVASRMTALAPAGGDAVPAADAAWHRLRTQLEGNSRTWSERSGSWLRRLSPVWGLALATAFLALLFAFAPVRTAFGQFLGVFRVHKFAAIRIDPANLERLDQASTLGPEMFGSLEVLKEPAPAQIVSLEAARAAVPFPLRTFGWLPQSAQGVDFAIRLSDSGEARLTLDGAQVNAALALLGHDDLALPPELDGATATFTMPPAVEIMTEGQHRSVTLVQMESPTVNIPAPVDPNLLGEIGLRVLGFAPDEARRLAAQINWADTLVLPLPADAAQYQEVQVDGATGLFIRERSETGTPEAMILWQRGGVVYALSGKVPLSDMLSMVEDLR